MTAPKPTHKPVGTIGLLTGAFFAVFAIVFIGMGIRDIRAGDSASPLFFLAWLVLIALVVVYWMKRKPTKPREPRNPPNPFLFAPLFLQDSVSLSVETCDGWISCHPGATAVLVIVVIGLFVGIWLINRKKP